MKLHPIQNSFQTGELSPLMLGRSDAGPYAQGLALLKNMVVDSRGPIKSRGGTRFGFDFPAQCARLETFQVDPNVYFNMIFTDLHVDVTSLTGLLPSLDLVENPYFNDGGQGWGVVTSGGGSAVDFEIGLCTMIAGGGGGNFAGIQEELTVAEGTIQHAIIVNTFGTADYEIRIGSAPGLGDYLLGTSGQARYEGFFTVGIAGPVQVFIDVRAIQSQTVLCTSVHVFDPLSEEIDFDTPWPCDALQELYFIAAPGGSAVYILHRNYQPQKLTYDIDQNIFQLVPVTFADPVGPPIHTAPVEWTGTNWPGVGTIFQGRLWLMSTANEKEWMWGSRPGEYEQFFVVDPDNPVADDAIMAVPMEHFGIIQWAIGTKNLVVGTVNGEYIVTSSDGLLRPGDLQIKRQSAYGSAQVQPQQINDQIVFVSSDRRKLRAMAFADSADNWISNDLLFLSEHLSLPRIVDIGWAQNPDNIIWCTLADGTMISCTYERNNSVIGWSRHETQGSVVDIAVGEIFGLSVPTIIAVTQPGMFNLEIIQPLGLSTPLDASVRKNDDVTAFDFVDGLEHLEGYECQILADGAVHPNRTVVAGRVDLNKLYNDVYVGLGFDAEFITLPFDKGAKTGSGASHMKRWNKIYVRLLNSAKPIINGDRPPTRSPSTPMNTPELPRTEDVSVGNLGWDNVALVHIKQDLPLDLTVLAIFGELGQENL